MNLQELQETIAKNKQSRLRNLGVWRAKRIFMVEPLDRLYFTCDLPFIYIEQNGEFVRADDATVVEILYYLNTK